MHKNTNGAASKRCCNYVPNVVCNARVKEDWVLWYNANCLAQRQLCHITKVVPVNQDSPLAILEVIESIQQTKNGRFAGSRLAD